MLLPDQIINNTYRVIKKLGIGGMADIYQVAHLRMPKKFAMKVMRLERATRDVFLERFHREIEVMATLDHPNIVEVLDTNYLPDGNPYLVMELLEGQDLATYLSHNGPLSIQVAVRICGQIGEALQSAHDEQVIHRDLKPSNVFLTKRGSQSLFVKLLDFGIAKVASRDAAPSTTRLSVIGTPAYMSPEQAMADHKRVDARTDQFALAVLLYEMLAGQPAFGRASDDENVFATLQRVVHDEPPALLLDQPQLDGVLRRALRKNPIERFPSVREFLAALGAACDLALAGTPSALSPSTLGNRVGELPTRQRARRVLPWVALSLAVLVSILGVARTVGTSRDLPDPRLGRSDAVSRQIASSGGLPATPERTVREPPPPAPMPEPLPPPVPSAQVSRVFPSLAESEDKPKDRSGEQRLPDENSQTSAPKKRTWTFSLRSRGALVPLVDSKIRTCLHQLVANPPIAGNTLVIELERSGQLQVTKAPDRASHERLNVCLEQVLLGIETKQLPLSVRIVGGR